MDLSQMMTGLHQEVVDKLSAKISQETRISYAKIHNIVQDSLLAICKTVAEKDSRKRTQLVSWLEAISLLALVSLINPATIRAETI